ncbi:hypothetical protein [Isachenkonia alkalipeptolytica]|uniref:Uncharacterized protein n=1 Tax=Isachenkonia alkalipeptolytica TaxID=2565777 RepID=A0AA44BDA3_9CLOT|nr:hypothetical protein [Isachenkonia alkalipeptolytica]NBG87717.1 hypothetical protein [Isachenkonia alkalipeptolytica]
MDIEFIAITLLYIHQTLDIIGVKGYVDRPELISPDTIGWSLLTVLMVLYYLNIPYVQIILLVLFGLVLFGLYHFHWKLYWFGASEKKIEGYNKYFEGTHRIIPESKKRLVPDTYHIVHTVLYLFTFTVLTINQILSIVD